MHLISVLDAKDYFFEILNLAKKIKKEKYSDIFKGRTLAMIFEKPSTRTRVSFEVAMNQLGGNAIYLDYLTTQLSRGEAIKDTARTLSRYVDAVMIRAKNHNDIVEFANYSTIPVINGLSDLEHPCQAISDIFTIFEHAEKDKSDIKLCYIGDGNNVCNSLILASAIAGIEISVATPKGYEPDENILKEAKKISNRISITHDPIEAIKDADFVYTDVWVSMGQESEAEERLKVFKPYQVNSELLKHAPNAKVMHCLPAKRGLEITDDVLDSEKSIVFDQAENRLHVQKAILLKLIPIEK